MQPKINNELNKGYQVIKNRRQTRLKNIKIIKTLTPKNTSMDAPMGFIFRQFKFFLNFRI